MTNVGIANLRRVVECAATFGFIGVESTEYAWDLSTLDPALVTVIEGLLADGNPCTGPCVPCDPTTTNPYTGCDYSDPNETFVCYPVLFWEATITLLNGTPTRYDLDLYQQSQGDPEAPRWSITYSLDASFNFLAGDCSI